MKKMEHKDFVKAAKDLNNKAKTTIKVVAVKGDVLKKSIKDTVKSLTDFDFSILAPETLDVFDELKCVVNEEAPTKDNVIEMKKEEPKERTINQQGPAMITAATDLIDFLGFPNSALKKFEGLDLNKMVTELQKMADEINAPYEENGKSVKPNDKPEDFKPETIAVFEANSITVNWGEEKKVETKKKGVKTDKPVKDKKADKKEKLVTKKENKSIKEKKEKTLKKSSSVSWWSCFGILMAEEKKLGSYENMKKKLSEIYEKQNPGKTANQNSAGQVTRGGIEMLTKIGGYV